MVCSKGTQFSLWVRLKVWVEWFAPVGRQPSMICVSSVVTTRLWWLLVVVLLLWVAISIELELGLGLGLGLELVELLQLHQPQ